MMQLTSLEITHTTKPKKIAIVVETNKMLKSLKLRDDVRIGFYFVIPYLLLILFLAVLMFTLKDGGWMLVPIAFITEFPFLPLILGFWMLIAGNEELLLSTTSLSSMLGIIIGGVINSFILFILGYFMSKLFGKRNIR
ncbi:MAG TPA: hypothetical protein VF596_11065 [Pyrinomonadaceae bacterium]|jgi:predicted MFS family arabinose efflux permease